MTPKRILLVGAGHAHLHVIAEAGRFVAKGHAVTVVAPGNFWYSGLATGMVGSAYTPEEDQVDIAALAARSGAAFQCDSVVSVDPPSCTAKLKSGRTLGYDVLSLNLGSICPDIPGDDAAGCYRVKPIVELARMRADLEDRFAASAGPVRVVVGGGGATGAELAANIAALAEHAGARIALTIVTGRGEFLRQLPAPAARSITATLASRRMALQEGARIDRIRDGRVVLETGKALDFDVFLNATGLKPPPLVAQLGLPVDQHGALRVDAHLRSIGDPRVHGAGDCIALEGHQLPRVGVYAIRQAPVLLANLLAAAEGAEPSRFEPQKSYLWILNLGGGDGLAVRGNLWWRGRAAFRLKDWIDRRFLAKYQQAGQAG